MNNEIGLFSVPFVELEGVFISDEKMERRISCNRGPSFQMLFEDVMEGISEQDDETEIIVPISEMVVSGIPIPDMAVSNVPVPDYSVFHTSVTNMEVSNASASDMAVPNVPVSHGALSNMSVPNMKFFHASTPAMAASNVSVLDVAASNVPVLGMEVCHALIPDMDDSNMAVSEMEVSRQSDIAAAGSPMVIPDGQILSIAGEKPSEDSQSVVMEKLEHIDYKTAACNQGQVSLASMNMANVVEIPTEKAEMVEPYNQIGNEIQLSLEKKGPMEFSMQLEPKHLGEIDVKLKIREGKLIIDIVAANPKTQGLLSGQVDKLIMSMGLQNVLVERVQVDNLQDPHHTNNEGQELFMNGEMNSSSEKQRDQLRQHWEGRTKSFDWQNKSIKVDVLDSDRYSNVNGIGLARMDYII